jgi:glycosyltransferase involved in cell wall biosynthesis
MSTAHSTLPVIYILDPSIAMTGALVGARQMARALAGTAHVVLVLPKGCKVEAEMLHDFWRVEQLPMVSLSKNLSAMLRYVPALIVGSWRLHRLIRRDGASKLILNDFYLMHGAMLRALGHRGRVISWVRCDPARFAGPLARPMLWLMRRAANQCIAVSQHVRRLLPAGVIDAVIYDPYVGSARTPKPFAASDEKPLVYVGNYIAGKGQDIALQAFALAAAMDATLTLRFYGGDMGLAKNRAYRAELEQRVQALGIASRVTFGAFVTDTGSVLAPAFAALNFSQSESFSMTTLEASGAGVPVIATNSGGPAEIIVEGVTGHLIPVGDAKVAAERIIALARDTALAARMGEAAAQHVGKTFAPEQFAAQLRDVLGLTH